MLLLVLKIVREVQLLKEDQIKGKQAQRSISEEEV